MHIPQLQDAQVEPSRSIAGIGSIYVHLYVLKDVFVIAATHR